MATENVDDPGTEKEYLTQEDLPGDQGKSKGPRCSSSVPGPSFFIWDPVICSRLQKWPHECANFYETARRKPVFGFRKIKLFSEIFAEKTGIPGGASRSLRKSRFS